MESVLSFASRTSRDFRTITSRERFAHGSDDETRVYFDDVTRANASDAEVAAQKAKAAELAAQYVTEFV